MVFCELSWMMISQITVAPVLSSFVRTGPFNASVSFSISEIPESLEVSLFVATNSTTVDEVQKCCYLMVDIIKITPTF